MSKKNKRYVLIYEPFNYNNQIQYGITGFDLNKEGSKKFVKIKKNHSFRDSFKDRDYLCDIDRYTNKYENELELLDSLGFQACHTIFSNTSKNSFYTRVYPVYNNKDIDTLLENTKNDRVVNPKLISDMLLELTGDNEELVNRFLNSGYYKTRAMLTSLSEYWRLKKYTIKTGHSNFEIIEEMDSVTDEIIEELTKYVNARAYTLVRQQYIKKKEKENEENNKKLVEDDKILTKDYFQYKFPNF